MTETDILRPMFSYSILPMILISLAILFLFYLLKRKKKEKKTTPIIMAPPVSDIYTIKAKYRKQIAELIKNTKENQITTRKAYQKLSTIIRNFIFDMTQIKVQNYSLEEIRIVDMPVLTTLVEEYYTPEFARESNGNIMDSIEKTRQVIERWK